MELLTRRLYHTARCTVAWHDEVLLPPEPGQVLVKTSVSALSGGTEGLFFRGEVPSETSLDATLPGLSGTATYPFRYGYCCVGVVENSGGAQDQGLVGRRVFAFEPHSTRFVVPAASLEPVADTVPDARAVLYPLVETAATLLLDAAPLWGERVAVFGLGPLGALTAALLNRFPLAKLTVFDPVETRVSRATAFAGAGCEAGTAENCDLVFDLGGTPESLAAAVRATGFGGRLVLGSWQGQDLVFRGVGTELHRKRIRLITSQVSTLAPELGRWNKARRSQTVWSTLATWPVENLITQTWPYEQAQSAFEALQTRKDTCHQVVLTYE